jgi:hypothetical protein
MPSAYIDRGAAQFEGQGETLEEAAKPQVADDLFEVGGVGHVGGVASAGFEEQLPGGLRGV